MRSTSEFVFLSLGELLAVCDQMTYAVEFLSGFKSRTKGAIQITRLDSIVYHIESHLIRVTMVADRSLQLVNVMFRLGLPERECRMSTVAKNQHVLRTPVAESLKSLDKLLNPYREQRNIVVHRKGHSDEELDGVAVYYLLEKSNQTDADREVTTRYFHLYKSMTDRLVQQKQQELSTINAQVFTALESLFADLRPVFEMVYVLQSVNRVVRADV